LPRIARARARVAGVDEEHRDARDLLSDEVDDGHGSVAVLHAGGVDDHGEQQPEQ
jgi:hypothetical protein